MDRLYNSALQAKKKEKFKKLSDQTEREEEEGFQIIYYSRSINKMTAFSAKM